MDNKLTAPKQESIDYFTKNNLLHYFSMPWCTENNNAYGSIDPNNCIAFPPNVDDLAKIHSIIRKRKCMTVLEFGIGYSTIIIADALLQNKNDFLDEILDIDIRCIHKFKLFSVDASKEWINKSTQRIPGALNDLITVSHSTVSCGLFNDQICHFYEDIPDVIPDFIYLDGPSGSDVAGSIGGSSFNGNVERTVMSGDLLRLEGTFVPGTMILVDGRQNNVRFLKNNFKRNWEICVDWDMDQSTFELVEAPLGKHNRKRLLYCLGNELFSKYETASI